MKHYDIYEIPEAAYRQLSEFNIANSEFAYTIQAARIDDALDTTVEPDNIGKVFFAISQDMTEISRIVVYADSIGSMVI